MPNRRFQFVKTCIVCEFILYSALELRKMKKGMVPSSPSCRTKLFQISALPLAGERPV